LIIQAQRRQEILADKFAAMALRPDTINKFIELLTDRQELLNRSSDATGKKKYISIKNYIVY